MIFSIIFMVTIGIYPDPIIKFAEMASPTLTGAIMP
jgi:hypothetical protein